MSAAQIRDQALWDQAEASLATALEEKTDDVLFALQIVYMNSNEALAPFAVFAIQYELHRRSQL